MSTGDTRVAVIGGGVVGCAVAHALARRGVEAVLLEAETALALGASGTNSGILHTGFDSPPGELETRLIVRSAVLREELLGELGVPVWRCGARLAPDGDDEQSTVRSLGKRARANGVEAQLHRDGSLTVPGEAVTDPVAFVQALAAAAQAGGAEIRLGTRVSGLSGAPGGGLLLELERGELLGVRAAVNCAGLFADDVARLAGEDPVRIYPRKGEFLVFSAPAGEALDQILLPVPSALGKGVLVFPTLDRDVVAGPTARERENKQDWSVEADAGELILPRARRMYPALERATQIGSYAGLRPAGRDANYVIQPSRTLPGLLHVAAIRSTGLSASLGIAEHVVGMLAEQRVIEPRRPRPLRVTPQLPGAGRWWQRASRHREGSQRGPAAR
ncbi:MAG TPA: FAD-dependent oxidoreductase [Solirubrobacteraceae bacterium]|jgi:glycerol-3-phosphate dehydrogenase|nr:FAD-dependent oxidoreductase [Solirubrobacteraceae bacterium]